MIFGENRRAISTLARCYRRGAGLTARPLRRRVLRLDPLWDLYVAILLSKNSARKSSHEPAQVFAELISRTSATRFSSQLLYLHLSGAILTVRRSKLKWITPKKMGHCLLKGPQNGPNSR